MMKQEFEALAGYEVSYDDYTTIIEPMYMATELSKEDFVKCIDKKRFALATKSQIKSKMKKIAKHLAETCEHYTDYSAKEELENLAKEYAKRFFGFDLNDIHNWFYFETEYTYQEIGRGCTYPSKLLIGRKNHIFEEIVLV